MNPITASSDLVTRSVSRYLQRRMAIRSGLLAGTAIRPGTSQTQGQDAEQSTPAAESPALLSQTAAGPALLVQHVHHQPTL